MKRRDFISGKFSKRNDIKFLGKEPKIDGNLTPETKKLDKKMAYHLLRRVSFGPLPEEVESLIGLTPQEAADKVLGDGTEPLPDGYESLNWLDTPEEDHLKVNNNDIRFEIMGRLNARFREFQSWWLEQMGKKEFAFTEKLTLFWSTVWTIEYTYDTLSLVPPPLLYRNNQLLRNNRLGNYKDLVLENTLDGAMLLYQSLHYSSGNAPNENFPRELLELFTMGIGNYTEGDIQVASALLTGWRTAAYLYEPHPNGYFNTYFVPSQHSLSTDGRTFMGVTIPPLNEADNTEYQVKEKEVKGIINIMFDKRADEIAKFVSEKIYRYFVYASEGDIDSDIINQMSKIMTGNNFNLKPVFRALLSSKHFYDENATGIQFKTPPEFVVGFAKQLNVDYKDAREACNKLEQILYDPPNVGSWKGYRTWISTTTLPLRIEIAEEILNKADNNDLTELVKNLGNYDKMDNSLEKLLEYFLPLIPNSDRITRYKSILEKSITENEWENAIENNSQNAGNALRSLIKEIIYSPDFQLI